MNMRQRLDDLGITAGEQVPELLLNSLLGFQEEYSFYYPPTPGEVLFGKKFIQGKIKESSDGISKLIAILNQDLDSKLTMEELLNKPKIVEDLYAPTSTLCLCQTAKGFVLIFKNKKRILGWDVPGGTLPWDGKPVGILNQSQRAVVHLQTIKDETMQETGVEVTNIQPWFVHKPSSKINHRYVIFMAKGRKVAQQRKEDKDCTVIFKDYASVLQALSSPLGNKQFVATRMITDAKLINKYFDIKA
jgi:hypothetical protein